MLALVAGVLVVGSVLARAFPRDTDLRFDLGEGHGAVVEASIEYRDSDETLASLRLRHPDGFPRHVRHTVQLAPGRYRVEATIKESGGLVRPYQRSIDIPAEGLLTVPLYGSPR